MTGTYQKYASVLVDSGPARPLDYGVKNEDLSRLEKGMSVQVLLRGKLRTGVIVEFSNQCSFSSVLPIQGVVSKTSLLTPQAFELAEWISKYYHTPLSKVLKLFSPTCVRKGLGHKEQQVVFRSHTLEETRVLSIALRSKVPKQAMVLDQMLQVEKSILLTELLEKSKVTRAVVGALVKKQILQVQKANVERNPLSRAEFFPTRPKQLNDEQKKALSEIQKALHQEVFQPFLLHGVTGSGKTEVYLQAIDEVRRQGKSALMLVPEVALTTQTIEKFKGRFKEKIAVLHHRLSPGERYDQWYAIREGKASIVIGARSAIFAPLDNIGVIIVDEEHEQSYKQTDEMPTYHARDIAVLRGKMNSATVILGTATPSLETYNNVENQKYRLLTLNQRVGESLLPQIHCIDMKREMEIAKGFTLFSQKLLTEIERRTQRGEQSILFLNRRGFHSSLVCTQCAEVEKCPYCDLSLTFHRKVNTLSCHLCDYQLTPPRECRKCKSPTLKFKGFGTENVESQLKKIFPQIKTLRMDTDTTKHVGSYEKLYYAFRNHKADVLIGTQMIAKGLHFPNVTLVGVLSCDQQFNLPDFKASEIAFQMLMQVAGRAGRGEIKGEVFIQTFNPQNAILKQAIDQDYLAFYQQEITSRRFFNYSPFTHLIRLVFKGKDEAETKAYAQALYQQISRTLAKRGEVFSPLPCGYPKIKEYYRFHVLLKGKSVYLLNQIIQQALDQVGVLRSVRLLIDVDPSSTFF